MPGSSVEGDKEKFRSLGEGVPIDVENWDPVSE